MHSCWTRGGIPSPVTGTCMAIAEADLVSAVKGTIKLPAGRSVCVIIEDHKCSSCGVEMRFSQVSSSLPAPLPRAPGPRRCPCYALTRALCSGGAPADPLALQLCPAFCCVGAGTVRAGGRSVLQVFGGHRHQKGPQIHCEASLRSLRLWRGGCPAATARPGFSICFVLQARQWTTPTHAHTRGRPPEFSAFPDPLCTIRRCGASFALPARHTTSPPPCLPGTPHRRHLARHTTSPPPCLHPATRFRLPPPFLPGLRVAASARAKKRSSLLRASELSSRARPCGSREEKIKNKNKK